MLYATIEYRESLPSRLLDTKNAGDKDPAFGNQKPPHLGEQRHFAMFAQLLDTARNAIAQAGEIQRGMSGILAYAQAHPPIEHQRAASRPNAKGKCEPDQFV